VGQLIRSQVPSGRWVHCRGKRVTSSSADSSSHISLDGLPHSVISLLNLCHVLLGYSRQPLMTGKPRWPPL
jgi:hypothetical protein